MGQRDEGLAGLEAFIATAAQTRAALQRDAGRVRDLSEHLAESFGDVEARLEELDDAIEAFDARYGDEMETILAGEVGALLLVLSLGKYVPYLTAPFLILGMLLSPAGRQQMAEAADDAILAYRAVSEACQRLEAALARAGEEAEEAFDEFVEAEAAARDELAEPWLPILSELGRVLQGHFAQH